MNLYTAKESQKTINIIGLSFLSINAIMQIYQSLIPLIMQRDLLLSEWNIGVINATINVIVCMLLLVLSKIKPTVERMVLFAIILSIALAITPLSVKWKNVVFFVILVCIGMIALSYIKVLANDFTLQAASAGKENSAMALTKIMSTVGSLVVLLIMYALRDDYVFYTMILLNATTVSGVYCVRKNICKEKGNIKNEVSQKISKGLKGETIKILFVILLCYTVYDAMLGTFSRYATKVWNMANNDFAIYQSICLIAAFIAYIPIGKLANEKNQKKITLSGLILMIIGLISMGLMKEFHFFVIIFLALVGIGWAAIAVNIIPILIYGVTTEEVSRLVGYYSVMTNISLIIAPIISGYVLTHLTYRMLYPILAIFLILAIFVLLFSKCENKERNF